MKSVFPLEIYSFDSLCLFLCLIVLEKQSDLFTLMERLLSNYLKQQQHLLTEHALNDGNSELSRVNKERVQRERELLQ